jgi:hypothetical protein
LISSFAGRGLLLKVVGFLAILLAFYQTLWVYWLAGVNIPDVEVDKLTGQKRIRRRPDKLRKRDHIARKDVPTDFLDGIMEGFHTLVSIKVPKKGLVSTAEKAYTGVGATFCHVSWHLQERDPSKVPMFKDLREQSMMCQGTLHTVDLYETTRKAFAYDSRNHTFAATPPKPGQGPVPPTAVVFHESRCGSTLIANVLGASTYSQSRVYSESPPPVAALKACEGEGATCDVGAQSALIQDVFYLMGRTTRPIQPQHVFYKIQSVGVKSIEAFAKAMPNTPWVFAYRDSIEVMMSHFKNYQRGNPLSQNFLPVCLRSYGEPNQPALLKEIVEAKERTVESLSHEEYCAAHLASLCESAIREYDRAKSLPNAPPRWFLNYNELPYDVWEHVLPPLIGTLSDSQMARMQDVAKFYSKGRGPRAGQHWHEDTTVKQGMAPESVKTAIRVFLEPSYQRLEEIRAELEAQPGY